MATKKGLGRGFDSLIPTDLLDESFDPTAAQDHNVSELRYVKLGDLHADPDQPRRHFDERALDELAASIGEHGILQPIVVTTESDGYKIVAGERRYRAAQRAGLEKVPVIVRTLTDQHRLELSLIENLQRHDLSPIETATAYAKLRDQFSLTLDEIGYRVGNKSVSTISNTLRLLKLPARVQQALAEGTVSEGQVRPLIGADPALVNEVLDRIIAEEWSARRVEQYISQLKKQSTSSPARVVATYESEALQLADRLAAPIDIRSTARGTGKIVISFRDAEDLSRITKLLKA